MGFMAGLFNPCIFKNLKRDMQAFVYGDNFIIKGSRTNLSRFKIGLTKNMIVNVEGVLGPDK